MIKFVILLAIFVSITIPASAKPESAANASLEEIDLGISGSLGNWYSTQSGSSGSGDYFGAYITVPVGDDLYIGFGSARPAESDGAYLARFTGTNLTGIGNLDEQGIHEMIWDGNFLHISGTDPTNGDTWAAGNHYVYTPATSTLTKYRDEINGLTNVIHSWGLWKDEDTDTLYAAVSAHDGSFPANCDYGVTCMGQIFASTNNGVTWTKQADLGGYRVYDITGYEDDLYAIYNDVHTEALDLAQSSNDGNTWNTIPSLTGNVRRIHMTIFDGELIAASFDRASLYAINTSGQVSIHSLPLGYLLGSTYADVPHYSDYNLMVTVNDYLYMIAENSSLNDLAILRTSDFSSWEQVVYTDERLISISYWANRSWLVVSSAGADARLWRVDLGDSPSNIALNHLQTHQNRFSNLVLFTVCLVLSIFAWMLLQKIKLIFKAN